MSGAGGQESTSGSSSRPPPPCIECLHELLASSKRLRGNAILPHEQVKVIVQHCAGVKERLEACKHRRQQQQQEQRFDERNSNPRHHDFPQQEDGSVELKHVLCPRHSGLINEALGMDLLRLCFRNLGAEDLCRCASVCKLWRKVVDMDELWNSLLHQLPCKNFVSLEDTNALRIPPKLRYVLYRNGSQWDERFCGSYIVDSGHPATTTASDEEQEAVAEFLEKRRTVVVSSSGSKLYQLIQHTTIDHTLPHGNNVGRTRTRKRFVVKACPSLCKGAGRWTVHLKRLCSSAVNAVGLEAEWKRKAGKQEEEEEEEEEEKYQEKTMALAWLFNTDGSDFPLVETNMEGTAVEMHRWHGFGDVVAPSFWRIMFDMDADRLVLDCGMRKEVQGCPLLEKKGLIKALREQVLKKKKKQQQQQEEKEKEKKENYTLTVRLVLLLESSKATLIDCCDA